MSRKRITLKATPRTRVSGYGVVLLCIVCFIILLWVITIAVRFVAGL